ncbi:hypothetical protein ACHWQZ_G008134 [Mnemiopsis leidyi]
MLRLLGLACLLVGGIAASQRCTKGIRGFAGPAENQYYDCRSGEGYAKLITCEDGMVYDKKEVACTENLLKRGGDQIVRPITDQISLGEPIKMGTLYNQRTNQMYQGYELYSDGTLEKFVSKTPGSLREVQNIDAVSSTRESRAKFGLGAELQLELMSGLIKIKGSAEYVKDEITRSNRARVVLKKEIEGDIFNIDYRSAIIDFDYCDLVKQNSGPTHFVSRIIYGQRSYMVFDKDAASENDLEAIKGSLEATIDLIPNLVIEGHIAIHLNGSEYRNDDELKVKFYGDTILEKVPRTWLQAVDTFSTVLEQKDENGRKKLGYSSPIKYSLTPLNSICQDQTAAVIRGITEDLVSQAISYLDDLTSHREVLNYLLGTEPAIRYSAIREQLLVFKTDLDKFYADRAAEIAKVLPLLKAGKIAESALNDILMKFEESAFEKTRSQMFLDYRKREIETILKILEGVLKDEDILLSDPVSATDNVCVFKKEYGTIFVLNLLPDIRVAQNFLESKSSWSEPESWVEQPFDVKIIGDVKKRFEKYVDANIDAEGKGENKCFMLKLGPLDNVKKSEMYLFKNGVELSRTFEPPQDPRNAVVCDLAHSDGFTLNVDVADKKKYGDVTGIEVTLKNYLHNHVSVQVVENESSVRVTGLLSDQTYEVSYRYVVQNGHGYGEISTTAQCTTTPASAPVALSANQISATSLTVSWAKPETVAAHLKDQQISYTVLINQGSRLDTAGAEKRTVTDLSLVLSGKTPGTLYSIGVYPTVDGRDGDMAVIQAITAPAAPAAPVARQIQDNRARFQVKVGEVTVPAGTEKELLSIKYYKMDNGQPISGSEVYYMQRLQGQGDTEIDIASFETGVTYGIQVKLLIKFGGKLLSSVYSGRTVITTTEEGSPIDNLRDNLNKLESSSQEKLDRANSLKQQLISTLNSAESTFNNAKSGGIEEINAMSDSISSNFAGIQQKSNVLQKSRCMIVGFWIWHQSVDNIKNINVNSVYDCLAACADTDGCSSASVNHVKSGNQIATRECNLGKKRNGFMLWQKNNFVSSNLYCQMTESVAIDTWKECIHENKEFSGASISSSEGISNIEECVAFCQSVEECAGVTYNRASKTCTAKNKRTGDGIQPNSNAESVSLMCLSANRGGVGRCAKNGVRFTGSVIQTTTVNSLDLCIQLCTNKHNCESVSYNASSRSCEIHNKRLGASRSNSSGWTSVNMYCLGLEHF